MRLLQIANLLAILCMIFQCQGKKVVHVPLDERFTTRVAFLNMAKITPYQIVTLPENLLPSLKKCSRADDILQWTLKQAKNSQIGILSLQTILYGSLINSRISNDSFIEVLTRVNRVVQFKKQNPNCKLYCSSVIMRIPHYNGDFEEPWYWASYGQLLFSYSYYCDKYNQTKDPTDLTQCQSSSAAIPDSILREFTWRRSRNHNIALQLLRNLGTQKNLFEKMYITLDDSAQFGYNAQEAREIKQKIIQLNLSNTVYVYPGADEVSLTLLSAAAIADSTQQVPTVAMIFRNSSTIDRIPNYEGLPMIQTLENQIRAAGGIPINGSSLTRGNVTLLVNNFDQPKQMQAPAQGPNNQKNYTMFEQYICSTNSDIIGLADNRYSNGADVFFVNYVLAKVAQCRNLTQWAYAGWNTNGNTLGTVVANSILLWVFRNSKTNLKKVPSIDTYVSPCQNGDLKCANSYFNALRILEDKDWQAILRELTRNYIYQTPGDSINDLSNDLAFYEAFVFKSMSAKLNQLKKMLKLQFSLAGAYFPWNRTFEIGLYGVLNPAESGAVQIE